MLPPHFSDKIERIVYDLAEGDITKRESILSSPFSICLEYWLNKRVSQFNETLAAIGETDGRI